MPEVLGFAGIVLMVFVPLAIKFEHRLTNVENTVSNLNDKIDALLNHNGLNPADCMRKKQKRR